MKKIKNLSWMILVISAFLFSGCYTQLAVSNSGNDNYGYSDDQNNSDNQNYQTPSDSLYGDQYNNNDSTNYQYYQDGNIDNNNYYGPYFGSSYFCPNPFWGYSPAFTIGFGWNYGFFDPYYWDPFGLWTNYYPYYYGPYPFYPTYYSPYYGNYWGGYGFYSGTRYRRPNDISTIRNNNGLRQEMGSRDGSVRQGNYPTSIPTRTSNTTSNTINSRNSEQTQGNVNTNSNNNRSSNPPSNVRSSERGNNSSVRSQSGSRNNRRNYNSYYSRLYRYEQQRQNAARYYNQEQRQINQHREAPRSYAPQGRFYSAPSQRTYSAPPQRSYSVPNSQPPARSSSGERSGGGSRGRR
jgi:hypothetical protein